MGDGVLGVVVVALAGGVDWGAVGVVVSGALSAINLLGTVVGYINRTLTTIDETKSLVGRAASEAKQVAGWLRRTFPARTAQSGGRTASSASSTAAVQTAVAQKPRRVFGTHPFVALSNFIAFATTCWTFAAINSTIDAWVQSLKTNPSAPYPQETANNLAFVAIVALLALVVAWIISIVQTIRLRRWGWLAVVVLLPVLGVMAFGLFGPRDRPQPRLR